MKKGIGLRAIYFLALTAVSLSALAVFVVFDVTVQRQELQESMAEQARTYADEMDAVWKFMDTSQDKINYTSDGVYEFKGLHCAIVGKSIGAIFSAGNEYAIRYTNFNPRQAHDRPDEFEAEALTAFGADPSVTEHYDVVSDEKGERFRFVQALEVDESCLECHGTPVGELDITGHDKEGWTLGSLGGAISITMPTDQMNAAVWHNVTRDVAFFAALMLLVGAIIYIVTERFVLRPVQLIESSFTTSASNLPRPIPPTTQAREMTRLIDRFNDMSDALGVSYANLEEKVEDRTRDLQHANEALARQRDHLEALGEQLADESRFKTDMLSMVSHELRTPLTSILATTQMSLAGMDDEGSEAWQSWEDVRKSSIVLLNMVNNLLDAARLDAGRESIECEPIDLGDLALAAQEGSAALVANSHLGLKVSVGADVPLVYGDPGKMQRITDNLVTNAIKFTPDGGALAIDVRVEPSSGDVLLTVTDTGIGIPDADQARIFERFVQLDQIPTRRFRGSGLGLSLVQEYAAMQGFTVSVSSAPGAGSAFTVRIPADRVVRLDEEE
ncbi:MAG: DUF3365 domain-containing protein [Eggerthellaceae bacterium]|nr:DUF3365 domain-containing protein [Eggerthellaceae bacterium]